MTDLITRQPPETADRPYEPPPDPPGRQPPRRPRRAARRVAAAAGAVVLVAGAGTAGGFVATELWHRPAATSTTATAVSSTATTLADVVDAVAPSVVTITVSGLGGTAEGSGVIVSNDGRILTNYHVVENARGAVDVDLSDGRSVSAHVLRTDPDSDLALLQADGVTGLIAATLGDSGSLSVGDSVLAFGSPLGLEGSVTAGIVSALDRDADELGLQGLVQTDAPINSGNSGGPLVDTAGRVVGITVANATTDRDGGSVGLGFAIPIEAAHAILT